jgi:acetyltransferase-like isoleucine patch superfamily enzyme
VPKPPTRPPRPLAALRDGLGARLQRLLHRTVEARLAQEVQRELSERLPEIEARITAAVQERARAAALTEPRVWGPPGRLDIAASAVVNDALLNTESGTITIAADAFFGHRVSVLTGTHDIALRGLERQRAVPPAGRDIHIGEGAWIGSGAIVLGPCRIGAHAVVAAGAVVTEDVAPETLVAGVPARTVRSL